MYVCNWKLKYICMYVTGSSSIYVCMQLEAQVYMCVCNWKLKYICVYVTGSSSIYVCM